MTKFDIDGASPAKVQAISGGELSASLMYRSVMFEPPIVSGKPCQCTCTCGFVFQD